MTIFELVNSRIGTPVTDQASAAYLTALATLEQEIAAGEWTAIDLGVSYGISSDASICRRSGNTITAAAPRSAFAAIESDCLATTIPDMSGTAWASGAIASWYGSVGHPGMLAFKCSATANSGYMFGTGIYAFLVGGGEKMVFVFSLNTMRATAAARMGMQNSSVLQTLPSTGVFLDLAGTGTGITVTGRCRNGSAETATGTTYTLATSTWYTGTIEITAGATAAVFTIYSEASTQLWQASVSSNLPDSSHQTGFQVLAGDTSTAGAIDIFYLDYLRLQINRTITR